MPSRIDQALGRIAEASTLTSGIVTVIMMVMITWDALGRKFGQPLPGALELSEAMMVATVYLALIGAQRHRENVFVSITTNRLSPRAQALLDSLAALVALVLMLVFTWIGFNRAWAATLAGEFRIATVRVPIWPFRWFIPIGLALLCLQLLADIIHGWRTSRPAHEGSIPHV